MTATNTTPENRQQFALALSNFRTAADSLEQSIYQGETEDSHLERYSRAEAVLITTPAPDFGDVLTKMKVAFREQNQGSIASEEYLNALIGDMERLTESFDPQAWLKEWVAADGAYLVQDGVAKLCCAIKSTSLDRQALLNRLDHGDNRELVSRYIVEAAQ